MQPQESIPLDIPLVKMVSSIPLSKVEVSNAMTGSTGAETQSDTSSDKQVDDKAVQPLLDLLALSSFDSFVIDCNAGLTGKDVMASFPCILDSSRFYVWLGETEINLFGKNALLNLACLAESKGAKEMYLVLEKKNPDIKSFMRMFKVIDAARVSSAQVQQLIRSDLQAKVLHAAFFKLDL